MAVSKTPWVFVCLCCVCVCCEDRLFELGETVPSVDASAED